MKIISRTHNVLILIIPFSLAIVNILFYIKYILFGKMSNILTGGLNFCAVCDKIIAVVGRRDATALHDFSPCFRIGGF